jgi:hypothetical protein
VSERLRTRPRRRRTGHRAARLAVKTALVLLVFAAGVALGQALEDNPGGGGQETRIRTLKPLELAPERETVTVTVPAAP